MGSLFRFDLRRYAETYDLPVLFETGTFLGNGVKLALDAGFESIYSVEIVEQYYQANVELFADRPEVTIIEGTSAAALDSVLRSIEPNILFWLDAHFPGADGGLSGYNDCHDEAVKFPLETEIEAIHRHRRGRDDVIIIDDLNHYETGDFAGGQRLAQIDAPKRASLDFIDHMFGETHHIIRLYDDQGYVLLLPNTLPPKLYLVRTLLEIASKAGVPVDKAFSAAFESGLPNR